MPTSRRIAHIYSLTFAPMYRRIFFFIALSVWLALPAARAQEAARFPIIDAAPGTPGLGAALRLGTENYVGERYRRDLVPLYLYQGKHLFAHGTSAGLHVLKNDVLTFDILARARFNRMDPGSNDELAGLRRRHQSADAGASLGLNTRFGDFQLTAVTDVLDVSQGSEVDLSYRYPIRRGAWTFTPFASLIWQDDKLTRYYYGVSSAEATPERPAYAPTDAENFAWGVNTTWHYSDKAFAFLNIVFDTVDDTIANSPIVRAQHNTYAGIGAAYLFGDQKRAVSERPPRDPSQPTWSLRAHYGYQLYQNIFPMPMAGDWRKSRRTKEVTPTQVGLTLSRLVQSTEKVDFFARLALYRHMEEPFQKDFWSYNAFMSAMFKSYSKWTGKIGFRWGVSFGISYAEELPAEEVQKFVNNNKNSSKLLNYLEWQIDWPLDRLIKSDFAENCFVGFVVTHRSGIFGTSDLLGNVAGGSDWGGIQLECLQ